MEYIVKTVFDDGMAPDPGVRADETDLAEAIHDCLHNDYARPFPVGVKVVIERIA